jgi:hypothetical protein
MTEFPAAVVHVVTQAPVVGAALMGLDLAGASVAAKQQLRRSFMEELTSSAGQPRLISLED